MYVPNSLICGASPNWNESLSPLSKMFIKLVTFNAHPKWIIRDGDLDIWNLISQIKNDFTLLSSEFFFDSKNAMVVYHNEFWRVLIFNFVVVVSLLPVVLVFSARSSYTRARAGCPPMPPAEIWYPLKGNFKLYMNHYFRYPVNIFFL